MRTIPIVISTFLLFLLLILVLPAGAENRFRSLIGYKYIFIDEEFTHDTHPEDNFLPNFNVSGSAGDSSIEESQWLQLGVRYITDLPMTGSFNLDAGVLVDITDNIEKFQNANDSRPAAAASFVYSKADMGFFTTAGYSLDYKRWKLGVQTEFNMIRVEHGWSRFDNEEEQDTDYVLIPSIGPKIGYSIWGDNLIETTVQFGKDWSVETAFQFRMW